MARVLLEQLSKCYGETFVVKDLSLDITQGEFLVLLGPSGCGKTTTLRMIAGFVEPTSGVVSLGGRDVTTLPPWKRNTGLVFQSYALFPHLSVRQNIGFGLEMRRMSPAETRTRVDEALRLVRLDGFGERLPRQLSGGQQQRVALARALAFRPDVLLLDEPLSNLDAKLRVEVRVEIRELQQKLGLTTVMVTHDQEEALSMADRLVVMAQGEARQVGTQRDLYERPADRFVASFVGRSNFIEGVVEQKDMFRSAGGLSVKCASGSPGKATLALRPEAVSTGEEASTLDNCFTGAVEYIGYLGSILDVRVKLSAEERIIVQITNRAGRPLPSVGDELKVGWPRTTGQVFANTA